MERKGNFPYRKNDYGNSAKAPGEKSRNKEKRRKHHDMVPVENSAGCAAAVFHEPDPERAPEKNADEVADIENDRKEQKHVSADYSGEIKRRNCSGKQKPDYSDFNGIPVAFFDVIQKVLKIADVFHLVGDEIIYAEF